VKLPGYVNYASLSGVQAPVLTAVTGTIGVGRTIIELLMPKPRLAGSLVLSSLNALVVVAALAAGYSGLSPWWAAVSLWIIPFPLVLFSTAYVVADAIKSGTRKQALIAVGILVPTVAVEWYFRFRGI
jgi:hypothetical protein